MTSFDPSPFGSLESPLKMDLDIQGCDPSNGNAILDKGSTFQRCDKAAHTDGVQTRAALPRETACYICFHHVGTHASWISRKSKMGGIFFFTPPAIPQLFFNDFPGEIKLHAYGTGISQRPHFFLDPGG